jgi:orotidine-5'-phosphate decarboxylase
MIERASRRAESSGIKVLAVTVLTSLDDADIAAIGFSGDSTNVAAWLGKLAIDAGAHGLVCSAAEVDKVRAAVGSQAILVTPGIRPVGAATGDQKRVATPRDAIARGADMLVVGRPLRDASDPIAIADEIVRDIELGLRDRVAS